MLTYNYTARNTTTGEKVKSVVQAESEQAAAQLIKAEGLAPIDIDLISEERKTVGKFLNKVPAKDKVLFSRQLATLLNAGLPLIQSLNSVGEQTASKPLKIVIGKIIADVESGLTLAGAMSKHPRVFNQVYLSLVAAGETSGTLDKALERLALQQEKDAELISKVRGAMVYPVIVLLVMGVVVTFMIVKVLPQVEQLYQGIGGGVQLPLLTRILLGFSHFISKFWWILVVLAVITGFFMTRWARTLGGKRAVDRFKMTAWPIGPLFMKMYMARFARTGTTLVSSGVPLIQVLKITSDAVDNVHIADSLTSATEKVRSGKALSEALTGDHNFLPLVPNMLKIGEQSGAIEKMLEKTAEYYEKEVDNQIKTVSTIIEPVLMIVLGVMAFIIVAAVLLPIYGLANKTIIH